MNFGITLSNRGVLLGITTVPDLLALADAVEATAAMDSVWVGDALYVNRRLDALTLLAAVAGRTERIVLGPACMGSFALRDPKVFAYEWASLDVISNGRTRLVVCSGGGASAPWQAESAAMGVAPADRHKRMIDHIHVLRHLWTKDCEPYESAYHKFDGLTLEPKPVQNPCPIWLATNAKRQTRGAADAGGSDFALERVGRIADGWMTHSVSPEGFAASWKKILAAVAENGRDAARFDNVLYHHINIDEDRGAGLADAKKFLDLYYGADYTLEQLEPWLTCGTPAQCAAEIEAFRAAGCRRITFRIATMGDPMVQLRRLDEEVLPRIGTG